MIWRAGARPAARTRPLPWYLPSNDLALTLAAATGLALAGSDCGRLSELGSTSQRGRVASPQGIGRDMVGEVDAEEIASWIVAQYGGRRYPGVVVGSAHGAAAHLAAALDAAYLPTGVEVHVRWQGGAPADVDGAMTAGQLASRVITATNPTVRVRQVHDPITLGSASAQRVDLHLRWSALPASYRALLTHGLERAPFVILLRDERRWPVFQDGRYSFQIGGAASDLTFDEYVGGRDMAAMLAEGGEEQVRPDRRSSLEPGERGVEPELAAEVRDWSTQAGAAFCSIRYGDARAMSSVVADLYRDWLRRAGKTAEHALVVAGRLVDPGQAITKALVPYWCENATSAAVAGAEMWLAGSAPFTTVHVLPEAPGGSWSRVATTGQWESTALFATRRGVVDESARKAYPGRALSPQHAARALRGLPADPPPPPPLPFDDALGWLRPATGYDLSLDPGEPLETC